MKRFIVVVLDGFGIGEMPDVKTIRKEDSGANTAKSILESCPRIQIPTLLSLGLMNALDIDVKGFNKSQKCLYSSAQLKHFGADTFWGHQELLGTKPKEPLIAGFAENMDLVQNALQAAGLKVEHFKGENDKSRGVLIVNKGLVIGDNLETDLGNNINLTATFDIIPFEKVIEIGRIVRSIVKNSRVIAFGAPDVNLSSILKAYEVKQDRYAGVSAPDSGVYKEGYKVIHLGYGVDYKTQIPFKLAEAGIKTSLIGKVADIAENHFGNTLPCVETEGVFDLLYGEMNLEQSRFICANVQETDLAGHLEDPSLYAKRLETADSGLNKTKRLMKEDDILIVMADHGNDPRIGHSRHTREKVPLLVYSHNMKYGNFAERSSLSDVAATAAEFFGCQKPEAGESFLPLIF